MAVKADWIDGDTVDATAMNAVGSALNTVSDRIVTPEDFGAVGDGTTDDTDALVAMFTTYCDANGGACILIPAGKVYASADLDIHSNTYVFGGGTLKMLYDNGRETGPPWPGAFIQFHSGVSNIVWIGPTLDINTKIDVNGFDMGQDPAVEDCASNIFIQATVRGSRINTSMEADNEWLYAGGGKGLIVGSGLSNVYARIRAIDCDIAASVETAAGYGLENIVLDVHAVDSHRTALLIQGDLDAGSSSLDSGDYAHADLPGCKIRLRAQGGQDATIIHPVTLVEGPNYSNAGIVTMDYASGVDLEVFAATPNRCTVIRGMATASTIRVNALLDALEDGWDTRPIDTHTPPGTFMSDNVFQADIHAASHYGVLVRPHRSGTDKTMVKTRLDVNAWCESGVGPITQSDGTTDGFGVSTAYRFCDMKSDPVKEITGVSSFEAVPAWSDSRYLQNMSANNFISIPDSTATTGGTTTLDINSSQIQVFTGTTSSETVKLPSTGVKAGQQYTVINATSGALVYVQSSAAEQIQPTMFPNKLAIFAAIVDDPSAAADWVLTAFSIKDATGATTVAMRDSGANLFADNFIATADSTVTAAATTTLDIDYAQTQVFTGTTTQTVKLPTTEVVAGMQYTICNNSSGIVTVQSSGANEVTTIAGGALKLFVAQVNTPTTAAHWRAI